jgi:hypothetical protein
MNSPRKRFPTEVGVPRHLRTSLLVCAAALAPAGAGQAPDVDWLPEAGLRLSAARYGRSEPQFKWSGWIGGGMGLVRAGRVTLRVDTDVETIIGSEKRTFDANQANYHLEGHARADLGRYQAQVYYHHVSRHLEDRPKTQAVDWNVLGVRVGRRFDGRVAVRALAGLGKTTQVSLVGYRWELTGRVQAELPLHAGGAGADGGALYGDAELRLVQADASPEFPRDGFLDARLEAGLRLRRAARAGALFLAFERRNDVFLLEPGARSRLLVGLRLGMGE